MVDALGQAVPVVQRVARGFVRLAMAALAGGTVIWFLLASGLSDQPERNGQLVVWGLVLAAPPGMLLLVALALRQLARIPGRFASLPDRTRAHLTEIGRLAAEARQVRQRGRLRSVLSVLRLWWKAAGSKELLEGAAPIALLLSPWMLVGGLVALGAALIEIMAGSVALLWVLLF